MENVKKTSVAVTGMVMGLPSKEIEENCGSVYITAAGGKVFCLILMECEA